MRLALFEPDIPQNLGAAIRLAACFGIGLDLIEPCGFPLTDKALKRAALDYGDKAALARHAGLAAFCAAPARAEGRLVLIETTGALPLHAFAFQPGDTLIVGRESAGSPPALIAAAAYCLRIPMAPGLR
ncbi:MAG: tRNA (cytidine(34)-2'-O)-methyltransferase, partial [Hyphomonadaceae bacterium]